ncbi:hypothetical protein P691DRAFT_807033 [Macrolepiota fuliginosa MF-IS2]|uniref:GST N-terminal domain-containing protein n=1 Tax=Macrolepiota fuliginosa MF-IS2 TaxID=1400762 RepID=A0A9P5XLE4_9AGAR|nr:hypothetical protein P691DRAFT_807033 [Macrolepiota fuliginosa MF-IS2]
MSPPVILYRYDASPYSHKVDHALILKGIDHSQVNVSTVLPRPEITDLLGITYRRIPILAIGNDVYCDTSLIVSALERRFPPSAGYATLLPPKKQGGSSDTGLIKAFSKYYVDQLFTLAPMLLPWDKIPASFVKDRSAFFGAPLDVNAIKASRPHTMSKLASHFALVEEQLSDDREWLFNTELPSLADISVNFLLAWAAKFPEVESLYDAREIPKTLKWLSRMSAHLEDKAHNQPSPRKLGGEEAAQLITSSPHESLSIVSFITTEADRLQLRQGDEVKIAPEDTARNFPTIGKLVALNREEVIIQVQGQKGVIHAHFPRLGFTIQPTGGKHRL